MMPAAAASSSASFGCMKISSVTPPGPNRRSSCLMCSQAFPMSSSSARRLINVHLVPFKVPDECDGGMVPRHCMQVDVPPQGLFEFPLKAADTHAKTYPRVRVYADVDVAVIIPVPAGGGAIESRLGYAPTVQYRCDGDGDRLGSQLDGLKELGVHDSPLTSMSGTLQAQSTRFWNCIGRCMILVGRQLRRGPRSPRALSHPVSLP